MSVEKVELKSKLESFIASGHVKAIASELEIWAYPEIADYILSLNKPQRILVYRALSRERAADVFAYFKPEDQDAFLDALTDADTRVLLANLSPDDRTAMLEELPVPYRVCNDGTLLRVSCCS